MEVTIQRRFLAKKKPFILSATAHVPATQRLGLH
jgi:hypothetical protein